MRVHTKIWGKPWAAISILVLVSSCTPGSPSLDIFVNDRGELTFQTERTFRWLIFPTRKRVCLTALRVYDESDFVWQIVTRGCQPNAFPIIYGKAPAGFSPIGGTTPLVAGKRYGVAACGESPFDTRLEFIAPSKGSAKVAGPSENALIIESPHDREDTMRAAAIRRGEDVPTVYDCSRDLARP